MDSFKVGLSWKGIFLAITYTIGIIGGLIFFLCLICINVVAEAKSIGEYLVFLAPFIVALLCAWQLSHLLSDRIIVHGDEVVIKRAFKKKNVISSKEIISYSNTAKIIRSNSYNEIAIEFGDKEIIYISDETHKNYDLLLYYLSKNCSRK